MELGIKDTLIRLLVATVVASIIGWEREYKIRPAGLRTHILVCVGATTIAMIQKEIMYEAFRLALEYPTVAGAIKSDPARLICQVISGIGFLGAGTIVVTKNSIHGLTTAASVWLTAILGIAIGMGYFLFAFFGIIFVLFSLVVIKKLQHTPSYFFPIPKQVEIQYKNDINTKIYIEKYFFDNDIKVREVETSVYYSEGIHLYTEVYTIKIPKDMEYINVVTDLSNLKNVVEINTINM